MPVLHGITVPIAYYEIATYRNELSTFNLHVTGLTVSVQGKYREIGIHDRKKFHANMYLILCSFIL